MNVIGNCLDELYRIFNILNQKYYNNELPEPVLTIQRGKSNNLGWFTLDKVWQSKESDNPDVEPKYEINITAGNLNRDVVDIVGTLHHEMVHYSNKIRSIKDCNEQIHNKKFKSLAEKVGLICAEKCKKYGYGITESSEEFKSFVTDEVKPNPDAFKYFRQPPAPKPTEKPEKKSFKYTCPDCQLIVKAERDKAILCGGCSVALIMEDY